MREGVDLAFHAQVVVEGIAVEVAELRGVPFQGGTSEWCSNVGFHEGGILKCDKALKMLYKEHDISIIDVFSYQNYLAFSVCPIEVGVEIAQIGLILPFCYYFWYRISTRMWFKGNIRVKKRSRGKRIF